MRTLYNPDYILNPGKHTLADALYNAAKKDNPSIAVLAREAAVAQRLWNDSMERPGLKRKFHDNREAQGLLSLEKANKALDNAFAAFEAKFFDTTEGSELKEKIEAAQTRGASFIALVMTPPDSPGRISP